MPEPFIAATPRIVEPFLNVTEPVGIPEPGAVAAIVAVNVTDSPNREGFAADNTIELVASLCTNCVRADAVPAAKSASPL